ncbi:ankyrin repeat domain-containing protein 10 isoform X3 [Strongylocentrotus purpuratus]|uniref:Ankyrin repeat domain-containing protein 10 n=1 Tax=Strongylocentrotus purpuratus TaxID=7668 RepID=A0A7M7HHT4_STRPU|nr:ankyrin repeat domain-containing protein 10 isoform X3 [Strongylocentrotus purpuratus]
METEFTELSGAEDLLESFPLHRACRDGDLCTLAGLLGEAVVSVCDASAQDPLFGWTPAHWAAHNGKVECLEMLVKAGLPCDIATHGTGLTLAHVAALEGQTACLAWLSKNGISINAQDHMGETAAHKAVRCGSVECLHILNQHGADLSLQSSIGSTVIDLAVQNHQRQCIEYFKAGGDSHLTNHMTCMNGRRKRMQTGEEALLDMDSAKRLKVESVAQIQHDPTTHQYDLISANDQSDLDLAQPNDETHPIKTLKEEDMEAEDMLKFASCAEVTQDKALLPSVAVLPKRMPKEDRWKFQPFCI